MNCGLVGVTRPGVTSLRAAEGVRRGARRRQQRAAVLGWGSEVPADKVGQAPDGRHTLPGENDKMGLGVLVFVALRMQWMPPFAVHEAGRSAID